MRRVTCACERGALPLVRSREGPRGAAHLQLTGFLQSYKQHREGISNMHNKSGGEQWKMITWCTKSSSSKRRGEIILVMIVLMIRIMVTMLVMIMTMLILKEKSICTKISFSLSCLYSFYTRSHWLNQNILSKQRWYIADKCAVVFTRKIRFSNLPSDCWSFCR